MAGAAVAAETALTAETAGDGAEPAERAAGDGAEPAEREAGDGAIP